MVISFFFRLKIVSIEKKYYLCAIFINSEQRIWLNMQLTITTI